MADLIERDAVLAMIDCCLGNSLGGRDEFDSGLIQARKFVISTPTANRWIPCSGMLPEVDKNVLIYYPKWEDAPVQTAHIMSDGSCWEFSDGEFYPSKNEITHWMPLPEPPGKR